VNYTGSAVTNLLPVYRRLKLLLLLQRRIYAAMTDSCVILQRGGPNVRCVDCVIGRHRGVVSGSVGFTLPWSVTE